MFKHMTNLDIIFQEWSASLGNQRALTSDSIGPNFEDIFTSFQKAGASFEEAHYYLPKVIKSHTPNKAVIKATYARGRKFQSEKEFEEQWIKSITNKATGIFFELFPRPIPESERGANVPRHPVVTQLGSFSAAEYRDYREYADGFEAFTQDDLDKLAKERQVVAYNPLNDPKTEN